MASPSVGLGLLSVAAGVMDAIAFLTLGEVFTSAMSGNTILFGLALGQGRLSDASHSLAAFAGYVIGVAAAALPLRAASRPIERALGFEALLLAAFAGYWTAVGGPRGPLAVYPLILLSAIAMGMQGAVGRAIQVPGTPTVVITSTLTAIVAGLAERALGRRPQPHPAPTGPQLTSFCLYLAGAVVAGVAASRWLTALPFVPLAAVAALAVGLRANVLRL